MAILASHSAVAGRFDRNSTNGVVSLAFAIFSVAVTAAVLADGEELSIRLQIGGGAIESPAAEAGQTDRYWFSAVEGQTYLVDVGQLGLDYVVTITSPAGAAQSYNSPLARDGREFILLEQADGGVYRMELVSHELTTARGAYSIEVSWIPASGVDPAYLEALRRMTAGSAAWALDDWESKERALEAYSEAAALWKNSAHPWEYAQALHTVAFLKYWVAYDNAGAVRDAMEAAEIYLSSLQRPELYANALLLSAAAMVEDLEFDRALSAAGESLRLNTELGNAYDVARAEELIGYAWVRKGELARSAQFRSMAADRFEAVGEWFKALTPRARAAVIEADTGYTHRAIETLEEIRVRLPEEADPFFRAEVLEGLGFAHRLNGNVNEALRYYDAALTQHRRNGDIHGEASALRGLGTTYLVAGHLDLAAGFLRDAATTAEGSSVLTQVRAISDLGTIEYLRGDYEKSLLLHRQASALLRGRENGSQGEANVSSRVNRAYRLILVGRDLTALGRFEEARMTLSEASTLTEGLDVPFYTAATDHALGKAWLGEGKPDQGLAALNKAAEAYEALGAEEALAAVLRDLADMYRQMGSLAEAQRYGAEAIERIESVRTGIMKPELHAMYSAARSYYYEAQVDLLMQRYLDEPTSGTAFMLDALTVNERSRTRMTMDLMAEASVDIRQGVDPELHARRLQLRDALAAGVFRQQSIDGASPQVAAELVEIEHALTVVESEIRANNPLYIGLSQPEMRSAGEMQGLVDPKTVLLQYALGADRSYAWAVTRDSIAGVELAAGKEIEEAASNFIAALRLYPGDPKRLRSSRLALSRLLLEPLPDIPAGTRIVVVADGILHYLPFSALALSSDEPDLWVVDEHDVVYLPSMSVLGALRVARQSRPGLEATAAVFADPVFAPTDSRLAAVELDIPSLESSLDSFARSRFEEEVSLDRLENTEVEARLLERLVPAERRLIARGFDADRDAVTARSLDAYRYLHFATHGTVDSQFAGLSRLFLSNFDATGRYRSGTLLLNDIYNLDLNADLVVLSACETALGQEIRGEGLVGFTQGFLYAGTGSLIVSLWQVPDRATAELMTRFYSLLFDEAAQLTPSEALRRAQSSMAGERRWSHPYLWAGFVLHGDWRQSGRVGPGTTR